jgi:hypothetical protein
MPVLELYISVLEVFVVHTVHATVSTFTSRCCLPTFCDLLWLSLLWSVLSLLV